MEKIKKYFASAISGAGFVNYFNSINLDNSEFQYILKGGAGTGKSTLMKKIAAHFAKMGMTVEQFYCSSDVKSLDGVRIVELGVSVVDGTAPHITEAYLPSVTHKIVNLGEFILDGVGKYETEMITLVNNKNRCFSIANKYQESALKLLEINLINEGVVSKSLINKTLKLAKNTVKTKKNSKKIAKNRKLFINSLENNENFTKYNFKNITKINLKITEAQIFFNKLLKWFNRNGYETVSVQNSLKSELIIGVFVEKLNMYFELVPTYPKRMQKIISNNTDLIMQLQKRALNYVKKAKYYHKKIEKIYYNHINFRGLDWLTGQLIQEIESRAR